MRRPAALLALLLVLCAGATACGDDTDVRTGDQPPGAADGGPSGPGGDSEVDATQVAIAIEVGGGFVPFGYDFATVPTVVLDNGTAFTGGAMTMQYPGPAMTPVFTGEVAPSALEELLAEASEIGLADDEELDAGEPGVTDMPTTTITVRVEGVTHTQSVYALSLGPDDLGGVYLDLTEEQLAVRTAVAGFVSRVTDAVAGAATEPFAPEAYQVLAQPAGGDDPEVRPNELDWPFSYPIAEDGRCQTIEGDDAVALGALVPDATQITTWTDRTNGTRHNLTIRAVLPGYDRDC
jgi:hypothetical protein